MRKTFHTDSAVAKVVVKEALAQPISAWPCTRDLNLPQKKRVPFVFSEKDYDASSSVIYSLYAFTGMHEHNINFLPLFTNRQQSRDNMPPSDALVTALIASHPEKQHYKTHFRFMYRIPIHNQQFQFGA